MKSATVLIDNVYLYVHLKNNKSRYERNYKVELQMLGELENQSNMKKFSIKIIAKHTRDGLEMCKKDFETFNENFRMRVYDLNEERFKNLEPLVRRKLSDVLNEEPENNDTLILNAVKNRKNQLTVFIASILKNQNELDRFLGKLYVYNEQVSFDSIVEKTKFESNKKQLEKEQNIKITRIQETKQIKVEFLACDEMEINLVNLVKKLRQ